MTPPPFADGGSSTAEPPQAVRPLRSGEQAVSEAFARYGRKGIVSAASARAFAEANPRLAANLGLTVEQFAERQQWSITLEEAVASGLFEPIENEDDPFDFLRKR